MLNQCILVGKITEKRVIDSTKNNGYNVTITLSITRVNSDTEDSVKVYLSEGVGKQSFNFLRIGAVVGVKARLKEVIHGKSSSLIVVGEKLTFINSRD
jgi:single-stranded DNA-binding protein